MRVGVEGARAAGVGNRVGADRDKSGHRTRSGHRAQGTNYASTKGDGHYMGDLLELAI